MHTKHRKKAQQYLLIAPFRIAIIATCATAIIKTILSIRMTVSAFKNSSMIGQHFLTLSQTIILIESTPLPTLI